MSAAGGNLAVRPGGITGKGWVPGRSGNPGGMSRAEHEWRDKVKKAIRKQETPERFCKLVAAMWKQATKGANSSPAAAKVYGELTGVKDALTLTEQERIQLGVRAELERLLSEAEAAKSRAGAIDVEVTK